MNSECERQRQSEGIRQAEERAECQREVQVEHRTEPTFPRNDNRQTGKKGRNDKEPAGRDRNIMYSLVGVHLDSDKVAGGYKGRNENMIRAFKTYSRYHTNLDDESSV